MAEKQRDIPSDPQVLSHLEKILVSPYFNISDTQSNLLSFVVRAAIKGDSIKETTIGSEIFEYYNSESHKVRANASLVRKKLKAYYKNEGKDDLVRIDLPPGPAYKAEFHYNIETQAVRAFARALAYQKRLSTFALSEAELLLDRAIRLAPGYAPSHAARAETLLLRLILDNIIEPEPGARAWAHAARESAEDAVRLDPDSGLGHIVLGVVWLSAWHRKKARREFAAAMKADSENTTASLWYGAYLMTIGRITEALELAKSRAIDDPGSFEIRLVYALFLYLARDYEYAMNMLHQVDGVELGHPLQLFLGALIDMATGHSDKTMHLTVRDVSAKLEDRWVEPHTSLRRRTDIERPGIKTEVRRGIEMWNPNYDPSNRFPGLAILSLAQAGLTEEAKEKMAALRKQRPVKSLQLALGYMGVGNQARAVASLRRACMEGDIFVNWLHLLPLFDPLREHPRFQRLVETIACEDDESE